MSPLQSPDCRVGKHTACSGDAWDEVADRLDSCFCPCHTEET